MQPIVIWELVNLMQYDNISISNFDFFSNCSLVQFIFLFFFFVSSNIFYWYNWHIKTEQQRFYNRIKKQPKVFVLNEPNIGLIVFLYCRIKFIQVALNTTNHQVHSSLFTHYSRYSNFFFSLFVSQKTSDVWEAWSHTFWVYFKVGFFALNTDLNISNKIKKHLVFIKQPITSKKSVVDRYIVVMLNT
jgi:hypothetical protein